MPGYEQLPGLEHLYLEDSWVLAVQDDADGLRFHLDAVLTEAHPDWHPPYPDEQYAYKHIALIFRDPVRVTWLGRSAGPVAIDATREADYGSIDGFTWDGDRYELEGEWGHVVVEGTPPSVEDSDIRGRRQCVCCRYVTLVGPPDSDEICQVCFWQDDPVDNKDTDVLGPNKVRLSTARENFRRIGASEERLVAVVRPPRPDEMLPHQAKFNWRVADEPT